MQIKFALVKLNNAETGIAATYAIGYFRGRWCGLQVTGARSHEIALRDTGHVDNRTATLQYGGVGTVNNTGKPFVEIAMLLRRHVRPAPVVHSDMAMDWKVLEITELSLTQLYTRFMTGGQRGAAETVIRTCLTRLLGGIDNERVQDLAHNIFARVRNATRSRDDPPLDLYVGLLCASPGVFARGRRFDPLYGAPQFVRVHDGMRRLGGLIAQCIHASRRGENFEGLYNDLLAMLCNHEEFGDIVFLHAPRIEQALAKIHNNTIGLAQCGHFEDAASLRPVHSGHGSIMHWCYHCYETRSATLADTGVRTDTAHAYWSDQHDAWYSYDIDADEGYRDSNGRARAIMDYSHNVLRTLSSDDTIVSSHYGDFLMGIELEMTCGVLDRTTAAKDVRRQLGATYCVIKNDGSLPDNGFEIVTAPRGIKEHIERFTAWQINTGYRAWDTNRCGMHVHIHSRAFTEMTLGKLLMFYNANSNAQFIRKLAGRHPLSDDWARRYCGLEGQEVLDNPKAAVKGKSPERYRIVNMQNLTAHEAKRLGMNADYTNGKYDTIELRIFKASLRKERLLAQIEFAHASVMFCRVASYRDLSGKAFLQWLAPQSRTYPNLSNWFGVRKSKAIKEAGGKPLEEACADRTPALDMAPLMRDAPRRRRALPTGINETVLPVVPRRPRRTHY